MNIYDGTIQSTSCMCNNSMIALTIVYIVWRSWLYCNHHNNYYYYSHPIAYVYYIYNIHCAFALGQVILFLLWTCLSSVNFPKGPELKGHTFFILFQHPHPSAVHCLPTWSRCYWATMSTNLMLWQQWHKQNPQKHPSMYFAMVYGVSKA